MPLRVGDLAPDFTLPSTSGGKFTLSADGAGQPLVLYFYPKDFTSVCTAEACDFRDNFSQFRSLDVAVIGVSRDDVATHLRFQREHNLPFELLADVAGEVSAAYQALVPVLRINRRVTYLLDKNHRVAAVFENMFSADQHARAMIASLKSTN